MRIFFHDVSEITAQFGGTADEIGLAGKDNALCVLCALLRYLYKAQRSGAKRFVKLNGTQQRRIYAAWTCHKKKP